MITKVGNSAANKNMAGIEKIDQTGQHISDHLPAIANNIECNLISLTTSHVDIFREDNATFGLSQLTQIWAAAASSGLHGLGCDRRSSGHGLQTTFMSARAQRTIPIHTNMSDITGRTITPTMDLAIRN